MMGLFYYMGGREVLGKKYNPKEAELRWQQQWQEEGTFRFDPAGPGPLYSIDTPPPTVSGALHIGHVFSYTQAEIIARYRRMQGWNVFYPFGFDDNGLPTERLVEKEHGKRGSQMERKSLISYAWTPFRNITSNLRISGRPWVLALTGNWPTPPSALGFRRYPSALSWTCTGNVVLFPGFDFPGQMLLEVLSMVRKHKST
jgi:hypothetical protein